MEEFDFLVIGSGSGFDVANVAVNYFLTARRSAVNPFSNFINRNIEEE